MATATDGLRGLRHSLRVVDGLSRRWFREVFASPTGAVAVVAIRPVVWFVLFGGLFSKVAELPLFPASDYRAFVLPGIVVFMSLEYIMIGGECVVADIEDGFLQKMWAAPISKSSVVFGRVLVMTTLNALQFSVLLAVALAGGVTVAAGLPGLVLLLVMTVLLTASITAISLSVAYALRDEISFTSITSFALLPILFVSNAFMPTALMVDWLAALARLNPVTVVVRGMRTLVIDGWVAGDVLPALALLAGIAAVSIAGTTYWFRRPIDREGFASGVEVPCGAE